jgi:lipopolysaccharide transport system ATP-binding protein
MPSDLAIRVRGLGKSYRIQRSDPAPGGFLKALRTRLRHPVYGEREEFWALRDVSFDVPRGEVLGVIGRNGAGKSTLLKLLSRITEPTAGEALLWGRTGSLLEVGTGFHRELTGRENIYLNGAMLGMERSEIDRRFDEIVEFAGVARFLETPVKRYSSGMVVRLAFAVAAHLRAEILIVDEVLAVGDIGFQNRCLDKMGEVTEEGRTVLFVSHNMGTMKALCQRCMLLQDGRITDEGDVDDVVRTYLETMEAEGGAHVDVAERSGTGDVEITAVRLRDERGESKTKIVGGRDVTLEIDYVNHGGKPAHPRMIANLYSARGASVTSFSTPLTAPDLAPLGRRGRLECRFPRLPLLPGRYRVALALHADGVTADTLKAAILFDVVSTTFFDTGASPSPEWASVLVQHHWEHQVLDDPASASGDPPRSRTDSR